MDCNCKANSPRTGCESDAATKQSLLSLMKIIILVSGLLVTSILSGLLSVLEQDHPFQILDTSTDAACSFFSSFASVIGALGFILRIEATGSKGRWYLWFSYLLATVGLLVSLIVLGLLYSPFKEHSGAIWFSLLGVVSLWLTWGLFTHAKSTRRWIFKTRLGETCSRGSTTELDDLTRSLGISEPVKNDNSDLKACGGQGSSLVSSVQSTRANEVPVDVASILPAAPAEISTAVENQTSETKSAAQHAIAIGSLDGPPIQAKPSSGGMHATLKSVAQKLKLDRIMQVLHAQQKDQKGALPH